jgi:hypothetical protein
MRNGERIWKPMMRGLSHPDGLGIEYFCATEIWEISIPFPPSMPNQSLHSDENSIAKNSLQWSEGPTASHPR